MAFMAMRKNLDERQRKKNAAEIFTKFDKNQNGRISVREFVQVLSHFLYINCPLFVTGNVRRAKFDSE